MFFYNLRFFIKKQEREYMFYPLNAKPLKQTFLQFKEKK